MARHEQRDGFRIPKVSFGGIAGALVGLACVTILIGGVPVLRWPLLAAVVAGGLCGLALAAIRRAG